MPSARVAQPGTGKERAGDTRPSAAWEVSSSKCRPDRQDGDVDQKFATADIPRPGLSLSLVLIKGYSIIMPQGEGFLAHNEPCVIAFVSRLGCNTDGSTSVTPTSLPPPLSQTGALRGSIPACRVPPHCLPDYHAPSVPCQAGPRADFHNLSQRWGREGSAA